MFAWHELSLNINVLFKQTKQTNNTNKQYKQTNKNNNPGIMWNFEQGHIPIIYSMKEEEAGRLVKASLSYLVRLRQSVSKTGGWEAGRNKSCVYDSSS